MAIAAITWNFGIAKYVIETYSRPFDLIYDSFSESEVTRQISEELLRFIEPHSQHANPLEDLGTLPDNLLQLICLDAKLLLQVDRFNQQQFLQQILRVLSPEGYCSVLISDGVRFGKIVPNGFQLVHRFLANGFKVSSINDQRASHGLPFQLLPHQYLAIFQKPAAEKKRIASFNNLPSSQLSLL
jgi:hypothetical protein